MVTSLAVGVFGSVAFVVFESRSPSPMLPLGLFSSRQFAVTNAVTFVVYAGLGGVLFLLPVVLQVVDGYSPLQSGLALLPITVVMLVLSARSGRLAAAIGPRLQMSVGPVVVGAGLVLMSRAPTMPPTSPLVLPVVLVLAFGLAVTVAPLTSTALNSVSPSRAGLASAVNNDVARLGSLIAVALLPALGRHHRPQLPPPPPAGPRLPTGRGHRRDLVRGRRDHRRLRDPEPPSGLETDGLSERRRA